MSERSGTDNMILPLGGWGAEVMREETAPVQPPEHGLDAAESFEVLDRDLIPPA